MNYEGIRQRTTQSMRSPRFPVHMCGRSLYAAMQPVLAQMAPLPANCTSIPAPSSCAVPNTTDSAGASAGADLVYHPAALPTTLREDSGAVRIDYNIGNSDRIFGRYSIDNGLTNQQIGLNEGQTTPLYLPLNTQCWTKPTPSVRHWSTRPVWR